MSGQDGEHDSTRVAGRLSVLEDRTGHIEKEVGEIKDDVKKILADLNKARGVAAVLLFLGMAIPAALASLLTWFLTKP